MEENEDLSNEASNERDNVGESYTKKKIHPIYTDEEDSSASSDETEEEVEPKLCYARIINDLPQILKKDAASCIAVDPKFLALGTHWGVIHILDHQGNNIRSKELLLHTTTVNQISIDENGDHIASCSDDGKVVIHGLYSSEHNYILSLDRPVRAVALDPFFYKSGTGRRFITGDDKVTLHEKTFLSRYKNTVLHQGEGQIRNIKWRGKFVACASDASIRVFDIDSKVTISLIRRDHDSELRPELYRCNMFWKDEKTLLIGWADRIKVCVVQKRSPAEPVSKDLPCHYVQIVSLFSTDFYICGIAALEENLVVLSVLKDDIQFPSGHGSRPQLRVIEPHCEYSNEMSSDILSVRGFQEYSCKDYYLESISDEGVFFILSPKDVIIAKPRDEDDHISWLLEHQQFEEALQAVLVAKDLKSHSLMSVGQVYMDNLLQQKKYNEAAKLCMTMLGSNKQQWEEEVYKFAQIQQLRAVAPYLPIADQKLDPAIYEMVLNEFLEHDCKGFLKLVQEWPSDLYSIPTIIKAVDYRLTFEPDNNVLLLSLGELYTYEKKFDKALVIYLKIGNNQRVFELIREHNLFSVIHDKLEELMELDTKEATRLLVENVDKVPITLVVSKLSDKLQLLYHYLDRLFQKDPELGEDHHGLLVQLYAEFDPHRLLSFLQSSNNYPLETALEICRQRSLVEEEVFLLGRMGNTRDALCLITEKLGDIKQAITFCKEHDDVDLWKDLIRYSKDKPHFITVLLQNIGTHVDPIILIQEIPQGMEIPGLRDSLVKILQDYNLQISLREGCKKILVSDCYGLLERLNKQHRRGIVIQEDQVCQACHRKVLVKDPRYAEDINVFYCKHSFHKDCLRVSELDSCPICSVQKRRPGSSNDGRT
ncbi:vacuolar protein sorting-associated protein light isoform X2 [Tachypleus tridentatus]|uniref:vacuolar protein sorting-associated protein light isoform X2 n=1 Tax=Tachypleus tridentatus TaxID=6853 RepID=UPI003FD07D6C